MALWKKSENYQISLGVGVNRPWQIKWAQIDNLQINWQVEFNGAHRFREVKNPRGLSQKFESNVFYSCIEGEGTTICHSIVISVEMSAIESSSMDSLISSLSNSFKQVPLAAIPAMLDCILTSTGISPSSLYASLLDSFPNLSKVILSFYLATSWRYSNYVAFCFPWKMKGQKSCILVLALSIVWIGLLRWLFRMLLAWGNDALNSIYLALFYTQVNAGWFCCSSNFQWFSLIWKNYHKEHLNNILSIPEEEASVSYTVFCGNSFAHF